VQQHDTRYLFVGFDPFPYLGRENLPMSVLTVNILDWFFQSTATQSRATGEALAVSPAREGDLIVTPRGDKAQLKPAATSFVETFYQGVYQLQRGREKELFAINLQDDNESDLHRLAPIDLRDAAGATPKTSTFFAFWPYLLIAALLLSVLEWFIHPRAARIFNASPSSPINRHA
jgi:hypothetical protein